MDHSFNIQVAIDFDNNIATFLNNLAFWTHKNIASRRHFYEDRYWMYNSYTAFQELFPYWTVKQLRNIITKAVKVGLVIKGNFNKVGYDNTNWYAMTDLALSYYPLIKLSSNDNTEMTPAQKGKTPAQKGRPIPDSNPDSNHIIHDHEDHALNSLEVQDRPPPKPRPISKPKKLSTWEIKKQALSEEQLPLLALFQKLDVNIKICFIILESYSAEHIHKIILKANSIYGEGQWGGGYINNELYKPLVAAKKASNSFPSTKAIPKVIEQQDRPKNPPLPPVKRGPTSKIVQDLIESALALVNGSSKDVRHIPNKSLPLVKTIQTNMTNKVNVKDALKSLSRNLRL